MTPPGAEAKAPRRGVRIVNDGKGKEASWEAIYDDSLTDYHQIGNVYATGYGEDEAEARENLSEALRRLSPAPGADPGWIATKERMPPMPADSEDGDAYMTFPHYTILHWIGRDIMSVAFCHLAEDRMTWIPVSRKITHWMPLPAPPEADDTNPQAQGGAGT